MKAMNKLLLAGMLSISVSAFAEGREGGSAGCGSAVSFQKRALEFIKDIQEGSAKYKKLNSLALDAVLNGTKYMCVDKPQPIVKYGYIQPSDATNHKKGRKNKKRGIEEADLIVIYKAGWDAIAAQDALIGKALACHELVSLKDLEETGVYDLCRGYIAGQMGLALDSEGKVKVAPPPRSADSSRAETVFCKRRNCKDSQYSCSKSREANCGCGFGEY